MAPRTLEMDAFESALRQYAIAHDEHAEQEQLLTAKGYTNAAEEEHRAALIALRAYVGEVQCPETRP